MLALSFALVLSLFSFAPRTTAEAAGSNAITIENALPGSPEAVWEVDGAGDPTIQGFATDISVNRGSSIDFKIDTTSETYDVDIYRLGYYGGTGARLVHTITGVEGTEQPACTTSTIPMGGGATTNGRLMDCGNWSSSASWDVPSGATSGVYLARPRRADNGGASHIPFIVRDDSSTSDLVFQTSDTTWQSYNPYGGYNAYGTSGATMAEKVSYNRPFSLRDAELENYLFNAEYPMIRWLERNGYDVSYISAVDTERHASLLTNHDAFLSVGHDEYWSQGRRDAVTEARDAGVHLAFFSANEIYWKTRWESSNEGEPGTNEYRTQVVYKEGNSAPSDFGEHRNCYNNFDCDPSGVWTGQWRQAPGSTPENSLSGQISWRLDEEPITVPADFASMRFWRNTEVADLTSGEQVLLADGTLGYEWDAESVEYAEHYPAGRVWLSDTHVPDTFAGPSTHHLSLYRAESGALVFGAGTVQWSWGLDSNHDRGSAPEDRNIQQATANLFADMGALPTTLQSELVVPSASTDTVAPRSTITWPTTDEIIPRGQRVTVTGTAEDSGGGAVAAVEVSTDGGATWHRARGRDSWTYDITPTALGEITFLSRAVDDSARLGTPSAGVTATVIEASATCPCTIWPEGATPERTDSDTAGVEVGVKFQAAQDGYISAIRFHKASTNTGTHVGTLWTITGTKLAAVTFTNETSSGWQQANFANPVPVTAGTTYVASYFAPSGRYSVSSRYFADAPTSRGPLTALQAGPHGGNGVYRYTNSASQAMPSSTYQSENYWVDVVFDTTVEPDTTPPKVITTTPGPETAIIKTSTNVTIRFDEPIDQQTLAGNVTLQDSGDVPVPATLTYDADTLTLTLDPNGDLAGGVTYMATVSGGSTGVADIAGNRLASDVAWSFTVSVPRPDPDVGPGGPVLVVKGSGEFGSYLPEILRGEGLNLFTVGDTTSLTAAGLGHYETLLLGPTTLDAAQASAIDEWVEGGGNLVAIRPDTRLLGLLGLAAPSGELDRGYLRVDTSSAPGTGIVGESMQFHGTADLYSPIAGAGVVATLYSNATDATAHPAVTMRQVGTNGGTAAAFTYDLGRSIVLTRQGNPDWVNQNRDGQPGPHRPNDLFYGGSDPDYVDRTRIGIPQADEQQRLLANILTEATSDRLPLPRFWYLPRGEVAAVVMTADEHNSGSVPARFDSEIAMSPDGCNVDDWECVRSTNYLYVNYPGMNAPTAKAYEDQEFEIALHPNTGCMSYERLQYAEALAGQLTGLAAHYPGLERSTTTRNHCIAWTDYTTVPEVLADEGIHLDTTYYYYPDTWVNDKPGVFTGSGFPQRYSTIDGELIDVYQAATQFTDESGQSYPATIATLLDRAIDDGFYGTFVGNLHTDGGGNQSHPMVVAAAKARGVPVISASQLLAWTDGRNASSFSDLAWSADGLTFTIGVGDGANGLEAMLPMTGPSGRLLAVEKNSQQVSTTVRTVKGVQYAVFTALPGQYAAGYGEDVDSPTISDVVSTPDSDGTTTISWATDEPSTGRVRYGTSDTELGQTALGSELVTTHSVTLEALTAETEYFFRVFATDETGNESVTPAAGFAPLSFTTPGAEFVHTSVSDFEGGTRDGVAIRNTAGGALALVPAVDVGFDGTSLPSGWTAKATPWAPGGAATVSWGQLRVDGTAAHTDATFSPGQTLEFTAAFGSAPHQHVGFATDSDFNSPWILVSTGARGDGVYARSSSNHDGVLLGEGLVGSAHDYRITWTASGFEFYVDGSTSPAAVLPPVSSPMLVGASDFATGGPTLVVDSVQMTPYGSPGSYTSPVLGTGDMTGWDVLSYDASLPAGTTVDVAVQIGNTPDHEDGSWSAWVPVSSGQDLAISSRYLRYRVTLAATDPLVTPVLEEIRLGYGPGEPDTAPPTVLSVTPFDGATDVPVDADVTASFNKALAAGTVSGATFVLRPRGSSEAVPATVSYAGGIATLAPNSDLQPSTVYTAKLDDAIADIGGNALADDYAWSFTTATVVTEFSDTTTADFAAGVRDATSVTDAGDGAVVLTGAVSTNFTGSVLTLGWENGPWTGGQATVSDGVLAIDGAYARTTQLYGPGRAVEFEATFAADAFQHAGFGFDLNDVDRWAVFGIPGGSSHVHARVRDGAFAADIPLEPGLVGTPHTYRIEWGANDVRFLVDGVLVHTAATAITGQMRPIASDYTTNGVGLTLDWLRMSPYVSQGTYESRVFDAGTEASWSQLERVATAPTGTSVVLEYRTGGTRELAGPWAPVPGDGLIDGTARYLQYRATLSTTVPELTPMLSEVSVVARQ